jgi:hypothetical protein
MERLSLAAQEAWNNGGYTGSPTDEAAFEQ